MIKDCPEPMKCRYCEGEHMAKDCPTYVATCKNCGKTEHMAAECPNARKIDRSHLPEMTGEEAWKLLEMAIIEKDLDEVKETIQIYAKAQPDTTFVELEKALRAQGYGLYLIPKERTNLSITLTNMDLQGNLCKKYTVNYRFSDKPLRHSEREGWPENHDQVLERLADAGDVVPWVGKPKCNNCEKLGHTSKNCPEDKIEAERTVVKCYNCNEEGHRIRDCPTPRVDKFACKNCGKAGHKVADLGHFSKDCPDNPNGGPRTCRNCGEEGHMAKECEKPRNVNNIQCRNCDDYGHSSRECPKPRDYSRVQCQNCKEMGHTKVRCKKPLVEDDAAFGVSTEGFDSVDAVADSAAGGGGGDAGGNWNASTGGGWN
ncbi:ATP-dependent RNA helicase glh-4 [Cytospora mali]|uniref:ATP-dependent RNA helicase glh-4 n=1 Tax=Cytospora mali TaxID=578113 RepID=A0A194VCL8_CYTMA|nr:ATP-dependent RNA helicase glh-4 [Valsa mali var. pyri (nom. inval.)]